MNWNWRLNCQTCMDMGGASFRILWMKFRTRCWDCGSKTVLNPDNNKLRFARK